MPFVTDHLDKLSDAEDRARTNPGYQQGQTHALLAIAHGLAAIAVALTQKNES